MPVLKHIIGLFLLVFFIVTRHDIDSDKFIADPEAYESVVQLRLQDATGIVEMEGTFIDAKWIVTAAHGLTSVEEGQDVEIKGEIYRLQKIMLYPDWEGVEHDIALIGLDRGVVGMSPSVLYKYEEERNQLITIAGRGLYGTGRTGPVSNDQQFRIATNRIDSTSNHWIMFRFDAPGDENVTELEGISGPGDSGGPAFIEMEGIRYLAGISSHQKNVEIGIEEGRYGVIEYYTRVSFYAGWIEDALRGVSPQTIAETAGEKSGSWDFPDTEIGKKASLLMDAIASNNITDTLMEKVFYKNFRESFDLKGFVQGMANSLSNPRIKERRKARKNVLVFTVESAKGHYLVQLEADRRDGYMVGGMVFKKLDN